MLLKMCGHVADVQKLAVQIGIDRHGGRGEGEVRKESAQFGSRILQQRGVECAADRKRQRRRAPAALHFSIASFRAARSPAMTSWPGQL